MKFMMLLVVLGAALPGYADSLKCEAKDGAGKILVSKQIERERFSGTSYGVIPLGSFEKTADGFNVHMESGAYFDGFSVIVDSTNDEITVMASSGTGKGIYLQTVGERKVMQYFADQVSNANLTINCSVLPQ